MFGRRKPKGGFEAFAKAKLPARFALLVKSKNRVETPDGFERTVAERDMPMLGAEMANSQSLKQSLKAMRRHSSHTKFFQRDTEFSPRKGDK